jgi:hypothetical protein
MYQHTAKTPFFNPEKTFHKINGIFVKYFFRAKIAKKLPIHVFIDFGEKMIIYADIILRLQFDLRPPLSYPLFLQIAAVDPALPAGITPTDSAGRFP